MALPTDPAEAFVREVDENLRRDQMADMAKSYGKWIVGAVILVLAAVGAISIGRTPETRAIADSEASGAIDKSRAIEDAGPL